MTIELDEQELVLMINGLHSAAFELNSLGLHVRKQLFIDLINKLHNQVNCKPVSVTSFRRIREKSQA